MPGVDLPVALHRQPLVQVVRVVVAAAEHVVVARHRRVAGRDEVGARQELPHQLRGLADLGVARDRVVAGGDLEVEPRSEHVLGQHLARAARHRQRERDARDGAVLNTLRAGGAHERKAARLEVEHRLALGLAHQRLGAAARGEPNLDPARRVGRRQERLRPRRVVAVDEDRLGAVHRQRLGVGDEAEDREPEVEPLLDRALRQDPRPAGLAADQDRDRVQRRVARHADGRLELGEAACRRLGRVGGEQRRVLLQVRHVRLVRRRAAGAQLLQREHQLDRIEHRDHAREPRRRQAARQAHELGARDGDVHEPPCDLGVVELGGFARHVEVEPGARR